MSFRPLNRCMNCGRTWYPRGSNVSQRCPSCGSENVTPSGCFCFLAVIVLGSVAIFSCLICSAVVKFNERGGSPGTEQTTKKQPASKPPQPKAEPKARGRAELRDLLHNKTEADVEQLLGAPALREPGKWSYEGELSYDPTEDRFDSRVVIHFARGRVSHVEFVP